LTRLSVILSNVARNHCYPIAEAAADAGYLRRFITSVYYEPHTLQGQVLRKLASRSGPEQKARLEGRRSDRIPDDRVVSIPLPELAERAAWALAPRLHFDSRTPTYLKNEIFDAAARRHIDPCTIFHGFEQCALFSLRRARALGATTVLDQPIMHRTSLDRLEAQERARLGVQIPQRPPFWHRQHIERKHKEHQLTDHAFVGLDFVKRTMVENGFREDQVFVIPYGADVSAYQPMPRPPREGFEILYVGPLHFWKGLHYLLDAFEGLDVPGARLTIIGTAHPDWAPHFQPRLAALGPRVRHVPGVPKAEMVRYYNQADVLAFPSLVGGIGLVCYEAMATALPVVTSDGDRIIRDGVDGLCVPARDVEGWRRALRQLASSRDTRLRLGTAGADRVKQFSWDAYRRGILRAYEEIAERSASSRRNT
jgi:glycosyltransferase involved in cell wall biosynthesis